MSLKIMVVDDEPDLRDMIAFILEKEEYNVEIAINGEDFLNKLDNFQPDLVTLDVMMPGLTTNEILKKIKEKKSNPKIILVSVVRFSEEEKNKIYTLGNIVDYITKPFSIDDFLSKINKHIQKISEISQVIE
jgi:DNA-binding response OmpR family regulator